jgi:putative transposase
MRIPRSIQLFFRRGIVHQFWRCHNKEFYLNAGKIKSLYLTCVKRALDTHNEDGSLKIYAYTVMDNHFHNLMDYQDGSGKLSAFLRQAHSLFGAAYNRSHKRSGKVAEGRPKTSLIENIEHLMRVHFYIEANPIRAAKCTLKQLRFYKYSSYRFYAYGIKDEFTSILTTPDWYRQLGTTLRERQYRYRALFQEHLGKLQQGFKILVPFIGSDIWQITSKEEVRRLIKSLYTPSVPEPDPCFSG